MKVKQLGLLALALILTGQGCLGAGSSGPQLADGALWRTEDTGANWVQMAALPQASGVGSIAGVSVSSMEIDPTDGSAYYIGSEGNGLFFSLDHGASWQRPEADIAKEGIVLDIEVDPRNVCTVYALKPDRIIKSGNCNRTYETIFTEGREDESLTTFSLDWFNPDTLWAGTSAGEILKSTDKGNSWSTVHRTKDKVTSVIVSNADSRIVLVGTSGNGIFRTTDGGANWESLNRALYKEFKRSNQIYGFAQSKTGGRVIMNSKYGLLESADNGATWKELSIIPPPDDQRIWGLAVNPKDENIVYYGVIGTYYESTVDGSWITAELPSTRAPKVILVHPGGAERVFVGFASVQK